MTDSSPEIGSVFNPGLENIPMRALIFTFISTIAISAAADCPNLAGEYICPGKNGGKKVLSIQQSESNGVIKYTIDGVDYFTDFHKELTEVKDGVVWSSTLRGMCWDSYDSYVYDDASELTHQDGRSLGSYNFWMILEKTASGDISFDYQTLYKYENGESQDTSGHYDCRLQD